MIRIIAKKELLELCRDRRLQVSVLVLWLLLACGAAFGASHYLKLSNEARRANEAERQRFLEQGEKHPHSAAHYGVFTFKSPRPFTMADSGLEPYLGSAVWLEAHKQNEMLYRPAEDATALQRFGDLTIASVGRVLMPLLIVTLGFAAFSGERESETLRQLMSLGVKPRDLLLGKALAIAGLLLVVGLPAAGLSLAAIIALSPGETLLDELARSAAFTAAYGAYLAGFVFLTLSVSAVSRSSRQALMILLAFWALSVLVLPRSISDAARSIYPTEAAVTLKHRLEANLNESHAPLAPSGKAAELLKRYGVARVEDLPLDLSGLSIQAGEERNFAVFDQHYHSFFDILRRQDRLFQIATLVSPAAGLQLISMALAGNDLAHHEDFIAQTEATRRAMQAKINEGIIKYSALTPEGKFRARAGRELWEQVPGFAYEPLSWQKALEPYAPALALLGLWLGGTFAAAWIAAARMRAA
jgi:ABC-2 type transport system permease protein